MTDKPTDGHGWYIVKTKPTGETVARIDYRYNLKEAAEHEMSWRFPKETLAVAWWNGQWNDDRPKPR